MNKNTVKRVTVVYEDGETADFDFDNIRNGGMLFQHHILWSVMDAYSEAGHMYLSADLKKDWVRLFVAEGLIDKEEAEEWLMEN